MLNFGELCYDKMFFPKSIFWEITYKCNQRCRICPIYGDRSTGNSRKDELTFSQIRDFIDNLEEVCNTAAKPKPLFKITGGEIFCKPDIFNILDLLEEKKFPYGLISNLSFDSKEYQRRLILLRPRFLNVSIDGSEEVHNRVRRAPGSLNRTIRNLSAYVPYHPEVSYELAATASLDNVDSLDDVVLMGKSLKLSVTIQHLNFLTPEELERQCTIDRSIWGNSPNHLTIIRSFNDAEITKLVRGIKRAYNLAVAENVPIEFRPNMKLAAIQNYYRGQGAKNLHCSFLDNSIRILPDGSVSPCMGDYICGNITDRDLIGIFLTQKFKKLNKDLQNQDMPFCKRCCKGNYSF